MDTPLLIAALLGLVAVVLYILIKEGVPGLKPRMWYLVMYALALLVIVWFASDPKYVLLVLKVVIFALPLVAEIVFRPGNR